MIDDMTEEEMLKDIKKSGFTVSMVNGMPCWEGNEATPLLREVHGNVAILDETGAVIGGVSRQTNFSPETMKEEIGGYTAFHINTITVASVSGFAHGIAGVLRIHPDGVSSK